MTIGDPKGEILDFQILKISREVVTPEVTRYPEDPKRVLSVSFKILEQDDGFCLQIIYVGSPSTNFTIDGQVEGFPYLIGTSQIKKSRFWLVYLNKVKPFGFMLIICVVLGVGTNVLSSNSDNFEKKVGRMSKFQETCIKWGRLIVAFVMIAFFAFVACSLFWLIIVNPVKYAKKEASQSLVESVPSSIIPHQGSTKMTDN